MVVGEGISSDVIEGNFMERTGINRNFIPDRIVHLSCL